MELYNLLLPNRDKAFIQPEKLTGYLLSETHTIGKSKARFFCELSFNDENVDILEQELLKVAMFQEISEIITTRHGTKYVTIGSINTPKSRSVSLLIVWIIDVGKENPDLLPLNHS